MPVGPCTRVYNPSQALSAWQSAVNPKYLTKHVKGTLILGNLGISLARLKDKLLRMLCDKNS